MTSTSQSNPTPILLRPYQVDALERINARLAAGVRRMVIVLATGGGKTTIAVQIILEAIARREHVLFLAHRRELISQTYRRLVQMGVPENNVGVLMGSDSRRRPGAAVQVASVDTLRNRPKPKAEIVFIDEAHRALASTYKDISSYYSEAVHLGLTATPYRADGRGLGDAYDELVVVASPGQLIAEGHLVEPKVYTVPSQHLPDLSSVHVRAGDYANNELDDAVNRKALVGNIVEHWLKLARGKRTVAFAVSVEHSRNIAARFQEAGVPAEHLDGATPHHERDAILARLDRGDTLVVSNCSILQEGWDQPAVKCAILARPTKSMGLYLQQAGRILRPWNDEGALILDHAGCALEHGLPQDDREFSLEGRKKSKRIGPIDAPTKVCPGCYAVIPAACRLCPECGHPFPAPELVPEEERGVLVDAQEARDRHLLDEWEKLVRYAALRGYKPGWAYYRFKEKFRRNPPRQFTPPPRIPARIQAPASNDVWGRLQYRLEHGSFPDAATGGN